MSLRFAVRPCSAGSTVPGSTLYLVWTQQRSDSIEEPDFRLRPSVDQLWSAPVENIFVIKARYWLGR